MRGNNYIVCGESCEVAGELTSTVSLWVICVASRCVSCSQHLVVVVSENAGTALAWNSNGSHYSLDWTTGLDYWTGLLDSPKVV